MTETFTSKIARVTPAGVITEFPVLTPDGRPEGITAGPDGNLWFCEARGAKIGRITPAGAITEFATPHPAPAHITVGPDGNLWFTMVDGNSIAYIIP